MTILSSVALLEGKEKKFLFSDFRYTILNCIPKSINIPFNEVYNEDGTIKSKADLEKLFKDAGINKDDEIVTYCTSGIRSGHMALILKSIGYDNVKNYDASYYEWAGDKTNPVEK